MTRPVRDQVPTWTHQVLAALTEADDLLSVSALVRRLGCTRDQVWAATHELVQHKAAVRVEGTDEAHFFATPEDDNRTREVRQIAAGIKRCRCKGLQRAATAAQSDKRK
jgi:DNA-binding IclR family transcriptional regulator